MWWPRRRFEILELLGEGSQGRVFKALRHDRRAGLRQYVAVKILHSKTAVNLWRQEFESLAKVNSPYCVRVLSFERINRDRALVLEYVEGISLARLGQICWLAPEDVQEIVAQLECALKDLHRQRVFHGDLSPQNVLIDAHGHVRVLDFGCANGEGRLTPKFAAPERMKGAPSSAAADLYSLGRLEDFLLGGEKHGSPYLHSDPTSRRFQDLSPCRERQRRLAMKIESLLMRQRAAAVAQTRSQQFAAQGRKPRSLKAFVLASITALMILTISSASPALHPPPCAVLKIRTTKWHYFLLNGLPLGYSPLSVPVDPSQRTHLQWISASGRGETDLHLHNFETRVLEDSDFSH